MLAAVSAGVGALAAFSPRSCAFCFGEGSRFFLEASRSKCLVWAAGGKDLFRGHKRKEEPSSMT